MMRIPEQALERREISCFWLFTFLYCFRNRPIPTSLCNFYPAHPGCPCAFNKVAPQRFGISIAALYVRSEVLLRSSRKIKYSPGGNYGFDEARRKYKGALLG